MTRPESRDNFELEEEDLAWCEDALDSTVQEYAYNEEHSDSHPKELTYSRNEVVPYVCVSPTDVQLTSDEYVLPQSRQFLIERIEQIIDAEAPIRKDVLIQKVYSSLGVHKSKSVMEATEKALKAADVKTTKQKLAVKTSEGAGERNIVVFYWKPDQDPDRYPYVRVSTERTPDMICRQELQNAICYVLSEQGALTREELIRFTVQALGRKRVGANFKDAVNDAIDKARNKLIVANGRKENALFSLLSDEA